MRLLRRDGMRQAVGGEPPGPPTAHAVGAAKTAGGVDLDDVRCDVEHSGVSIAEAALDGDDVGREIGAGLEPFSESEVTP